LDGAFQLNVKVEGQPGWLAVFERGDCVAPLYPFRGLSYSAEAVTEGSVIEISPAAFKSLPDNLQVRIYKGATASTGKINAYLRAINGELSSKNFRLSQYILNQSASRNAAIRSEFIQTFIRNMRQLQPYARDLVTKLLDDHAPVQDVVEGIGSDPALVALVLRTVNSPQYGFVKKIESFYHACMILGFNNIYSLLIREAVQSTLPITRETTRIQRHSCLISVLCFEIVSLASQHQPPTAQQQAQTASTIGMLHDLGAGVQVIMRNAHPAKMDFINTLEGAKLGVTLLRDWGIPERICKIVEFQQQAEFMPPNLIAPEFRTEIAALHLAHVLEILLMEKPVNPSRSIYTSDYMSILGFGNLTPGELLKKRILPSLTKNRIRIPPEIHSIILKPAPVIP
jgi:HD-like signal output (HDOD) protein